jgi:two-component system nitrate/nitrite response regulator NarL
MEIARRRGGRVEVCVVVIAVDAPGGQQLIHIVVDDEREQRMRRFLESISSRASGTEERSEEPPHGAMTGRLTRREQQVLALLSADLDLQEIADKLLLSRATVRNHVQHMLSKLGVHSILEAVAVWLLDEPHDR